MKKVSTPDTIKKANIELGRKEAQFYDSLHTEIWNELEQKRLHKMLRKIIGRCKKTKRVLDIGCGTGNLIMKETAFFDFVIGIDISKKMIEILKNQLTKTEKRKVDLVLGDTENLPFQDGCFDFITMYSVLHHLPNVRRALIEASRVLNMNGGIYVDHEPNAKVEWTNKITKKLSYYIQFLKLKTTTKHSKLPSTIKSLDYSKADIHAQGGFHPKIIARALKKANLDSVKIGFHYNFRSIWKSSILIMFLIFLLDLCPLVQRCANTIWVSAWKKESKL